MLASVNRDDYFNDPALSQSELLTAIGYKENDDTNFDYHMGQIIDLFLYSENKFYETYCIVDVPLNNYTTETIRNILDEFYRTVDGIEIDNIADYANVLHDIAISHKYQTNYSVTTMANNIWNTKNGKKYYELLRKNAGKMILDLATGNQITMSAEAFSGAIRSVMVKAAKAINVPVSQLSIEYQVFLKSSIIGVECKGLVDAMIVYNGKPLQVIDTKVTKMSINQLKHRLTKMLNDFQVVFYTMLAADLDFIKMAPEMDSMLSPALIYYSLPSRSILIVYLTKLDVDAAMHGIEYVSTCCVKDVTIEKKTSRIGIYPAISLYVEARNNDIFGQGYNEQIGYNFNTPEV